jgi:hypothetical protein
MVNERIQGAREAYREGWISYEELMEIIREERESD